MNDQEIIYVLAGLGLALAVLGKLWKRTGTVLEWLKESWGYILAALILTTAMMLIGPGDGAVLGSYVVRTWAFGIAVAINEGASAFAKGPTATNIRKMSGR